MSNRINLQEVRTALNTVLDYLMNDLKLSAVEIDPERDLYWHVPVNELNDMSKAPKGLDVGKLGDDFDFVKLIGPGEGGDAAYNLVHIAPLLRYIGENVRSFRAKS